MSIKVDTTNRILINGKQTGLALSQHKDGSDIYTPESANSQYKKHAMPFNRYSTAHDAPCKPGEKYDASKCAGKSQLETDIKQLLARL